MHNKEIDKLKNPNGVTYVTGLGFITTDNTRTIIRDIRKLSNIICFCLLLYFFCQRVFIIPSTYLVYFLGFNISINNYTGLVISSEISRQAITFFANSAAMLVSITLACLFCSREFKLSHSLKKPYKGFTLISLPIIIVIGFTGDFLANLFSKLAHSLGFVFTKFNPIQVDSVAQTTTNIITVCIIAVIFEEILFRGIILQMLRKYGDGFAVISSSIVFALFQGGIIEIISSFMLGLALGYFVIRSGSIYVSILGRSSYTLLLYGSVAIKKLLSSSFSSMIILLGFIIIICLAILTFSIFITKDRNAFVLKKPTGCLSLRHRLFCFCSTISFILLSLLILSMIVNRIQIIG